MDKIKLTIKERILLSGLLPDKASYLELLTLKKLREELLFNEDEVVELGLQQLPGGGIKWNPEKSKDKEFAWKEPTLKVVRDALKSASDSGSLPMDLIDLYERVIPEEDRPEK